MNLKDISEISIHIKDISPTTPSTSFLTRLSEKVKRLVFKYFNKHSTPEIEFKTTLALLFAQEGVKTYFLQKGKRREDFYSALKRAAHECGWKSFSFPQSEDPHMICQELTRFPGQQFSLVENPTALDQYSAVLNPAKQRSILFSIFDRLERPPIHSVMEVKGERIFQSIALTTQYAQYKILEGKPDTGTISYSYYADHATSSIRTLQNSRPDKKGAMNQRVVRSGDGKWIGSYCGELSTPFHVLEQILLIAGITKGEVSIVKDSPEGAFIHNLDIVFTSLFAWYELPLITDQKDSIRLWDQKILLCDKRYYRLNLLYYNIPFNTSNRLPIPAETKAIMKDINEETGILLLSAGCRHLRLPIETLSEIAQHVDSLRSMSNRHFLEKEKILLNEIDAFRALLPSLIKQIKALPPNPMSAALQAIYDKRFSGMDKLICLDYVVKELGLFHNKNSLYGTDRIAGAMAADKAQYAFQLIENKPFIPLKGFTEEKVLFKNFYSNYFLKEEPEVNAAFSSGFKKNVHQNPETRHYLT